MALRCTLAAFALLLVCAGSAGALGLGSFEVTPSDTRAGAHADLDISFTLTETPPNVPGSQTDDVRNVAINLPAGLLPNALLASRCPVADFERDRCADTAEVGQASLVAFAFVGLEVPIPVFGTVYLLEPQNGETARLGIVVRPVQVLGAPLGKIFLPVPIRIRDEGDYGLEATVSDIPTKLSFIDIRIASLTLTINGDLRNGPGYFASNPTTCIPAISSVDIEDYAGNRDRRTSTFSPTDCAGVPFQPNLKTTLADARTDTPSEISVDFGQPRDVGDRIVTMIDNAEYAAPPGITLNPALADGLGVCSDEQFGPQGDPDNCPESSQVGTVALTTPVLGTLPGKIFYSKNAENPYRLFIIGTGFGVNVKLKTILRLAPDTGDVTLEFPEVPQVPFTNFNFKFFPGPRGGAVTPLECGSTASTVRASPWSGIPDEAAAPDKTITAEPNTFSTDGQGNCNPTLSAALNATTTTSQARADLSATIDLSRPERDRPPTSLSVKLPEGLLGRIESVPPCPEDRIASGDCPETSRIGAVSAAVGSGPQTVSLPGTAYLAGQPDTALRRIVLVVPARVGPVDVGTFVQVADVNLDPADNRLTVETGPIKPVQNGFPIRLRRLQLTVDRPGLLFNPSGCDVRGFDITLRAIGLSAPAASPYQATGCEKLPFDPTVGVRVPSVSAREPGDPTPVEVSIGNVPIQSSGLDAARLVLPRALRANTDALVRVCQAKQLAAQQCPENTRIGTAYARTPLLAAPLTGPVYIAQTGITPRPRTPLMLPYAVAFLRSGPTRIKVTGSLAQSSDGGRVDGLFEGLPDVPLDEFRISLDSRTINTGSDLCSTTRGPTDVAFDGQSGRSRVGLQPELSVDACGDRAAVRMSARGLSRTTPTGSVTFVRNPDAGRLTAVTATLPRQLRPTGSRRAIRVRADGRRVRASAVRIDRRRRTVTVRVPGGRAASRISIALRRGSLRTTAAIRRRAQRDLRRDKAASIRLSVTGRSTDNGMRRPPLTVRFDALARR